MTTLNIVMSNDFLNRFLFLHKLKTEFSDLQYLILPQHYLPDILYK